MIRSLALLLGLAALAQVDAAGVPAQNETYKIVYFGDDRPLLIELDARLDRTLDTMERAVRLSVSRSDLDA